MVGMDGGQAAMMGRKEIILYAVPSVPVSFMLVFLKGYNHLIVCISTAIPLFLLLFL